MAEQKPIISIDHVSMRFNLAKEKHESLKEYFVALLHGGVRFDEFFALDDVSFDIMPGDFYGLIGLNGSGKSTLLKVISGVYKPSAGSVTVNGTIAPLIELGAGFDMDLTARENIYLNGTVLGYTPKYIDSKFDDIVDFSELQDFLDVPLKNYSSGMVARLAFAVATMTKPDILIADEILSVGDFLFQEKCEKRMAELLSGGTTVIWSATRSTRSSVCATRLPGSTTATCAASAPPRRSRPSTANSRKRTPCRQKSPRNKSCLKLPIRNPTTSAPPTLPYRTVSAAWRGVF